MNNQSFHLFIVLIAVASLIVVPASAGTKYMSGSPDLSVSIIGSNEFPPGTTLPLKIQVQNSGLNQIKFVQSGIVETDDNPSTAKMVTVSLLAEESPVLIEYTYLENAEQMGTDSITYRYVQKKLHLDLPFIVKSAINLEVEDVVAENINAGGSGFITLHLRNTGSATGSNAIANLSRSGNSPIVPVSSSVFLGSFPPNANISAKYKVSVSKDAEPQEYPVAVSVTYENEDGETQTTPVRKVGIPVGADIEFTLTSQTTELHPGKKESVEVTYRNDGSVPVYGAEVRISAVDPFSSSDDLAFLGDIQPGESAVARFGLNVEADADTKTYGLDSEIKYRDALQDSHVSETIKVPVSVVNREGLSAILSHPVVIGILVILLLGGAYYLHEMRRSRKMR